MVSARLEIAVQDQAGVDTAVRGGADRVEVCQALELGGLTPSAGLVEAAVEAGSQHHGFVNVLIRPRSGGYEYEAEEIAVMCRDIRHAADAGAHGVVIGALTSERLVDSEAVRALVDAAGELHVTFHRALDVINDPVSALTELASLGIRRVLTSGGAPRCSEGIDGLTALSEASMGMEIMAGGGVDVATIPDLIHAGVGSIHLSARENAGTRGAAGPGGGSTEEITRTSPAIVAAARHALSRATGTLEA